MLSRENATANEVVHMNQLPSRLAKPRAELIVVSLENAMLGVYADEFLP